MNVEGAESQGSVYTNMYGPCIGSLQSREPGQKGNV